MVLRRLVEPLTLWDESERPERIRWEASPKTDLLDDLAPTLEGTSPTGFEPVFWALKGSITDRINANEMAHLVESPRVTDQH
jgi:hypothetical protein